MRIYIKAAVAKRGNVEEEIPLPPEGIPLGSFLDLVNRSYPKRVSVRGRAGNIGRPRKSYTRLLNVVARLAEASPVEGEEEELRELFWKLWVGVGKVSYTHRALPTLKGRLRGFGLTREESGMVAAYYLQFRKTYLAHRRAMSKVDKVRLNDELKVGRVDEYGVVERASATHFLLLLAAMKALGENRLREVLKDLEPVPSPGSLPE